ncbi:hypothetical protein [Melittangium boletus]|uniref:hypothetical protein n=1 Tax=Melittangium boletus TaxID=83453 RepID=UPI003DA25258
MRPFSWLVVAPVCLGLAACTEAPVSAPPPAPSTTRAAVAAMPPPSDTKPPEFEPPPEEPLEATFATFPSSKAMMERLRERLKKDPVDTKEEEQAFAEVAQNLERFKYTASTALVTMEPELEEPLNGSFIADSEWATERVRALYGASLEVSCLHRPCIRYGDFDGDGKRDLVVQVADDDKEKAGIAFLLADGTRALLGAGRESPVGDDLLWVDTWRVEPGAKGEPSAVVLGAPARAARTGLSAPGKEGERSVTATWSCMASSQVPVLTGPKAERGAVTRSGVYENQEEYEAWRAFDDNAQESLWISEAWPKEPVWIGYEWTDGPRRITSYVLTFANGALTSRAPRDFELQGANDGDWETVDRRTEEGDWKSGEQRRYAVTTPVAYSRYRLLVTEDNDDRAPIVAISLRDLTLLGANCDAVK